MQHLCVSVSTYSCILGIGKKLLVLSALQCQNPFTLHVSRTHEKDLVTFRDWGMDNDDDAVVMGVCRIFWGQSFFGWCWERQLFFLPIWPFHLRMQAKMLLPASTVSTLIEEFQEVYTNAMSQLYRLCEELSNSLLKICKRDGSWCWCFW